MNKTDITEAEKFTPQQLEAIKAEGNVLVIAGAGTGKTRTLVERCVRRVIDRKVSLDEILMVTFTDAAAAEMRKRIREQLQRRLDENPSDPLLSEQLALLETAQVCTLHSFCAQLVRQHFYELGMDPRPAVLTEQQARVLQEQTFDALFQEVYLQKHPEASQISALLHAVGHGRDGMVRELVRQIHHHTQTRHDPDQWFKRESAKLETPDPKTWKAWLSDAIRNLDDTWRPLLNDDAGKCEYLSDCIKELKKLRACGSEEPVRKVLERIREIGLADWGGKKGKFHKPVKGFFADVEFLYTVTPGGGTDPVQEDWEWTAPHLRALLGLAHEFASRFESAKRANASIDFHDLEQYSLRLLWRDGEISELAKEWQQKFKLVFVDEYQDINPAQDQILRALSRSGEEANRFLVGDVKQSIYRFRQADSTIFKNYATEWNKGVARTGTLLLSENFRGHEWLIEFVNDLFRPLMTSALGGVEYEKEGGLLFGDRLNRPHVGKNPASQPRTEVILCLTGGDDVEEEDRTNAEHEARTVALRLKALKAAGTLIWDEQSHGLRPVDWKDMVVLLRAASGKVETYAKEFSKAKVPLLATGGGLFGSLETQDLLNLLLLLDNPLQDRPLLAVLRSPLAGLSTSELAQIRLAARKTEYWTTLDLWHKAKQGNRLTFQKVDLFLERFHRWRSMARSSALTQRLEAIIEETHYFDWLSAQSRPEQRRAHVQQLLSLARDFDASQRQGLYGFLQFLEAEEEAAGDREPAPGATHDAVRLMTIHKSKGLEFPVVIIPDLGKPFNCADVRGEIILDPELGICSRVHAPESGQTYPSLPFWLARKKQNAEMLSEELRLLYVGVTRARDWLILSGACADKRAESWATSIADYSNPVRLLRARSYLDWLGPWFARHAPTPDWLTSEQGAASSWRWQIVRGLAEDLVPDSAEKSPDEPAMDRDEFARLMARLTWSYAYTEATTQPGKSSVTALRRETAAELEVSTPFQNGAARFNIPKSVASAAEIGIAHHLFLQSLELSKSAQMNGLEEEAERLVNGGVLSPNQSAVLDLPAIHQFWDSEEGRQILMNQSAVQRELAFTVRLTRQTDPAIQLLSRIPEGEFIIVQGAVDLAVLLADEIWILDFKTDQISLKALDERVREYSVQLQLYGIALSQIYQKPVTRRWLHFLRLGKTIEIADPVDLPPSSHPQQLVLSLPTR